MRIGLLAVLLATALTLGVACGGGDNAGDARLTSEGAVAPDFILPDANGGAVTLHDVIAEKDALLYFSMGSG